jgi:hypothetical protein
VPIIERIAIDCNAASQHIPALRCVNATNDALTSKQLADLEAGHIGKKWHQNDASAAIDCLATQIDNATPASAETLSGGKSTAGFANY